MKQLFLSLFFLKLIFFLISLLTSCQQKGINTFPKNSNKTIQEASLVEKMLPEKLENFQLPVGASEIISDFGSMTGVGGKKRKAPHQGIDIHDIPGIPILAVRDGSILEVHDEKCWGLTIAIDHGLDPNGEKLYALYGHLGAHSVEQGQKSNGVKKLGKWGMT